MAGNVSSNTSSACADLMAATVALAFVDKKMSSAKVTMASKVALLKVM